MVQSGLLALVVTPAEVNTLTARAKNEQVTLNANNRMRISRPFMNCWRVPAFLWRMKTRLGNLDRKRETRMSIAEINTPVNAKLDQVRAVLAREVTGKGMCASLAAFRQKTCC